MILRALLIEYGILAIIVSAIAFALGSGAGWFVVTRVLELEWEPDWVPVLATVIVGAVVTIGLALAERIKAHLEA